MGIGNAIIKAGSNALGKSAGQVAKKATEDILKNTVMDVVQKSAIDTASKGFGNQILKGIRQKVFNLPAKDAQSIINAFPSLYRTDFGTKGNDIINTLKNDGGAVLSGYAKFDNVKTGNGTRRLAISRDSFDRFFKRPENSFLANYKNELGGSPRTEKIYPMGSLRNAQDVLEDVRNSVLDYYANADIMDDLSTIGGADDFASGLLEEIAKSKEPISSINEFKMPIAPRDITEVSNISPMTKEIVDTRKLMDDKVLTLANGETVYVPANSLFGNFDDVKEDLYKQASYGKTTDGGYKYTGDILPKDALKSDPKSAIYNKLVEKYGPSKTREIMAYYGGDIGKSAKSGQNSFLGKLLTGEEVQSPLVMYHGVDSDKLRSMLRLAKKTSSGYAIPNPSVQVIDPSKNAGRKFGDIILLGNKSIPGGINPYTGGPDYGGKYNLYSRDVYSPRKPVVENNKEGVPYIRGTRQVASPANISKYMNKTGDIATENSGWVSPGSMAATQAKRFKTPVDAIKNQDLLKAQKDLDKAFREWEDQIDESVSGFIDKYMEENPDENIPRFIVGDRVRLEVQSAMNGEKPWDDPYGIFNTKEGRKAVETLKEKASNLPTAYFEGKAKRAVPLKEFSGALLPKGYSEPTWEADPLSIQKALEDSGVSVLGYYDPNNYEESVKSVLQDLIKDKDRFTTPFMFEKADVDANLSPEQREFFKDSVVRDENGNLKEVYHGTNSNFSEFGDVKTEPGYWFTEDKNYALSHGKNLKTVYLNMGNPLDATTLDGNNKMWEYAEECFGRENVTEDDILSNKFRDYLEKMGYDGMIFDHSGENTYIAFYPEQIKNVDNLTPTNNPDIRYAKKGESLVDIHKRLQAMNKSREMSSDIRTIGSKDVAKIDENTLPKGYKSMVEYINEDPTNLYKKLVGVDPEDPTFADKIAKYVEDEGYDVSKNVVDNIRTARRAYAEKLVEEMNLEGGYAPRVFLQTRSMFEKNNPGKGLGPRTHTISAEDGQIYQTNAAKMDREYSNRLGIGRSHTPMNDNSMSGDAQGAYFAGGIGLDEHYATGESGVSTVAHERMHAWQDAREGDWDKRFIKARDELRDELADHYHSREQIAKDHPKGDIGYYARDIEQEARMLQSYLDNEGFTNTWKKQTGKVEWGDEIKPAFDKFYKKLRALSKAGVALPAIALLFGLNTNGGEKDSKKA